MNNTPVTPEELTAAVVAISAAVLAQHQRDYPTCELNWDTIALGNVGPKYARLVVVRPGETRGGSVYCFIDMTNGNLLKAAGWKTPAKGARGNIRVGTAANWFNGALTANGAAYMR
jgi:hypothetical protein